MHTPAEAARRLLAAVPGISAGSCYTSTAPSVPCWAGSWPAGVDEPCDSPAPSTDVSTPGSWQDWGRRFLPQNGGCVYVDMNHIEFCTPETLSAYEFLTAWHAMLRIARRAQQTVNEQLPPSLRVELLATTSDGLGASWGSHLNLLTTRRCWDELMLHRVLLPGFFASFLACTSVLLGQGKVGCENGAPPARYQLCQRADFSETLMGYQTTWRRPLINTRNEPLCGPLTGADLADPAHQLARVHIICFDTNLAHTANVLKAGLCQICLAMAELEQFDRDLILDDPLAAMRVWNRDPSCRAKVALPNGTQCTAPEWLLRFLELACWLNERGALQGVVPKAGRILQLAHDTAEKLQRGQIDEVAKSLDWALKLRILEETLAHHRHLDWDSPELKELDHLYGSLDDDGLYWAYEKAGFTEQLVSKESIAAMTNTPPVSTRAWTRAMLLRAAEAAEITWVNWDVIRLRITGADGRCRRYTVNMPYPLGYSKREVIGLFHRAGSFAHLLRLLGAEEIEEWTSQATCLPVWEDNCAVSATTADTAYRPSEYRGSHTCEDPKAL